jgi:hypothetical protein
MMMTEMDIETSVYYVHLTRLIAREDFIKFTRREGTKTYIYATVYYYRHSPVSKKKWRKKQKVRSAGLLLFLA